jgi:hypothetical protein
MLDELYKIGMYNEIINDKFLEQLPFFLDS